MLRRVFLSATKQTVGATCRRGLATSSVRPATFTIQDEDDFKDKVLNSKSPVIVDFSATWCGPCKMLTPRLDAAVAATEGAVDLAIVDIDELADLALDYQVSAVPTVMAVRNGKVTDKFMGLVDEDKLDAFVTKLKQS